jgi:D-amino peptidase
MRIYVVCDLEGTAGVVNYRTQCSFNGAYYLQARRWATLELNALVEGALAGGATEIVAWDGHGPYPGGLDIELVHPACRVILNAGEGGPPLLDRGWDALFQCGLHAMADAPFGVLDHSFERNIAAFWLNDVLMGEVGMNIATAGSHGVPCVFLAGDRAGADEARALVPDIVTAVVKEGLREQGGLDAPALSLSPGAACDLIRARAQEAMARIGQVQPWALEPPYVLRTRYRTYDHADAAARRSGVESLGAYTVQEQTEALDG